MKKIEAVVRPFDLDAVRLELLHAGIDWMTIGEVLLTPGHLRCCYRGATYQTSMAPRLRIELAVPDGQLASALDAMTGITRDGDPIVTDILVLPLYDAVQIRTGEHLVWPRPDRAPAAPAVPRRAAPPPRPAA